METAERELITKAIQSNIQLRRLYEEHKELEDRLGALERRGFLTAQEEIETKLLKRKKLHGKERMMAMLAEERVSP
jgi:uncharacterized protein YdcH (DUF465 family)